MAQIQSTFLYQFLSPSVALLFGKIPRYIITLHELLAHTPHEHVERKSLEFAKSKLEELSRCVSSCQTYHFFQIHLDIGC